MDFLSLVHENLHINPVSENLHINPNIVYRFNNMFIKAVNINVKKKREKSKFEYVLVCHGISSW